MNAGLPLVTKSACKWLPSMQGKKKKKKKVYADRLVSHLVHHWIYCYLHHRSGVLFARLQLWKVCITDPL